MEQISQLSHLKPHRRILACISPKTVESIRKWIGNCLDIHESKIEIPNMICSCCLPGWILDSFLLGYGVSNTNVQTISFLYIMHIHSSSDPFHIRKRNGIVSGYIPGMFQFFLHVFFATFHNTSQPPPSLSSHHCRLPFVLLFPL